MATTTNAQPDGLVSISSPPPKQVSSGAQTNNNEPMAQILTKLVGLRRRYLRELVAAREKVKKNFLV